MTTPDPRQQASSNATLARVADAAAARLIAAASAIRHGRLTTARQNIAAASVEVRHIERRMP